MSKTKNGYRFLSKERRKSITAFFKKYDKYLTFGLFFKLKYYFLKKRIKINQNDFNYFDRLGIELNSKTAKTENDNKIEAAFNRAWKNRDFEIDKFWSRAAYFWTFIAVIFGVYFALITFDSIENKAILSEIKTKFKYIELYVICLGLIFSFAWRYVIIGSKKWQENWEKHVDYLEDYITGPLYKTVFRTGKFYSVSKINLILSNVIILAWFLILFSYIDRNNALPFTNKFIDYNIFIPIVFTIYIILQFMFGYGRTAENENRFIDI